MIFSISISADSATVASGSSDMSICLWNIYTGECYCVIKQEGTITHIKFSPANPKYLLSVCDGRVWQWNVNGHQTGPTYDGHSIAFSPDGTQFVLCNEESVTVQNSSSGVTVTKVHMGNGANPWNCCFSPDGKLVAVSNQSFIYVWDITSSNPHLIETFPGIFGDISTLLFSSPSSLISVAGHKFIKLWQIGSPSMGLAEIDPGATPPISARSQLLTLQAKDGIIITSENEVLKVWDISTSLCKASFHIPPKELFDENARLINGRLIVSWCDGKTISLWDVEKGELLWTVDTHDGICEFKISQDGSRIFCLYEEFLQALSAKTGGVLGQVKLKTGHRGFNHSLTVDGLEAWVHHLNLEPQGWNLGISDAPPAPSLDVSPYQSYINSTLRWDPFLHGIKNEETGKVVFWVPEKYGRIFDVQWNEHCLVICFLSKEVLIFDFSHIL